MSNSGTAKDRTLIAVIGDEVRAPPFPLPTRSTTTEIQVLPSDLATPCVTL